MYLQITQVCINFIERVMQDPEGLMKYLSYTTRYTVTTYHINIKKRNVGTIPQYTIRKFTYRRLRHVLCDN